MAVSRTILFASLVLGFIWACGSSSNESSNGEDITWGALDGEVSETAQPEPATETVEETVADYKPAGQGVLSFVSQFGDDAKICVQTQECTFIVPFNGKRSLDVTYEEDGVPVANVPLKFTIFLDENAVGKMDIATLFTDQNGVASGTVKAVKAIEASFKVKVEVAGATT